MSVKPCIQQAVYKQTTTCWRGKRNYHFEQCCHQTKVARMRPENDQRSNYTVGLIWPSISQNFLEWLWQLFPEWPGQYSQCGHRLKIWAFAWERWVDLNLRHKGIPLFHIFFSNNDAYFDLLNDMKAIFHMKKGTSYFQT